MFAAALTAAVAAAGCGSDDSGDGAASGGGGRTLTVYSSLPLQGASKNQSEAIGNGMELALKQAGGKVGNHDQVRPARRLDRAGRRVDPRGHDGQRPQGGAGRLGDRVSG